MLNIKKVKPLGQHLVVTMDKYGADEFVGTLIDPKKAQGSIKEFQKVVAVSDYITKIKVGDLVCVNANAYAIKKFHENSVKNDLMENTIVGYNIPQIEIDGQIYMFLNERDIEYVIEEYTDEQPQELIIGADKHLIIP